MKKSYMKFQNCILINFERTDKPKAICSFNFSKVGGIKIKIILGKQTEKIMKAPVILKQNDMAVLDH